jgi:lysophospholipase L1-like esterase
MSAPLSLAGAARRAAFGSLLGSLAALGVLSGQLSLVSRRIPRACAAPPPTDATTWTATGADRRRRPLTVAFVGDSMAAGYGVADPQETLAGQLALHLSVATRRRVLVRTTAVVGARSRDLRAQLSGLDARPDLAIVVVGANDVTHQVPRTEAVRHLTLALHRLRASGAEVVVATCPDIGSIPGLAEPLRSVARLRARQLAEAQARAARCAGGRAVALAELGPSFLGRPEMWGADRFHPSAAGYRLAAELVAPVAIAAVAPVRAA